MIRHGGTPAADASVAGDLYRVWMDVKSALAANNAKAVLQSCEKGEDIALNTYNTSITEPESSADNTVVNVLKKQEHGIHSMHDRVKTLRDMQ